MRCDRLLAVVTAVVLAAACGRGGGHGFHVGAHEPLPQIPDHGGPILAAPRVVTVTFPGYAFESDVQAFGGFVTRSSWLAVVGSDYGVGLGSAAPPVVLSSDAAPAAASDADTQALLAARVADGTLPAPDADTLYVLYYPSTTIVSDFSGNPNCNGALGGYHWEMAIGTAHVPYAVVPQCSSGTSASAYVEVAASHELIEAATDALPLTAPAWAITDASNPWTAFAGEVADPCETVAYEQTGGLYLQRAWSNRAAAADTQPCVPAPAGVFYDTSATPPTRQDVAAGSSVTFTLRGWSTAQTADWSLSSFAFGSFTPTVTLGATTLNNGRSTTMTVGVPAGTAHGATAAVVIVSAHDLSHFDDDVWPVAVTVP